MTDHLQRILDACSDQWQSVYSIAEKMGRQVEPRTLTPNLMRLELKGYLERNWDEKWHRWRRRQDAPNLVRDSEEG